MSIAGPLPTRIIPLPKLARALEARYPGVRVTVKRLTFKHSASLLRDSIIYRFYAPNAEMLLRYRLAELDGTWLGKPNLRAVGAPEVVGCGGVDSRGAYVFHRLDEGEPLVGTGRAFPLKKTIKAVDRIWRRITAPRKRTRR